MDDGRLIGEITVAVQPLVTRPRGRTIGRRRNGTVPGHHDPDH